MLTLIVGGVFVILESKQILPHYTQPQASFILSIYGIWLSCAVIFITAPIKLMHKALNVSENQRLATAVEISKRKAALDKLQESEERYKILAENINDVIWSSDLAFNWIYISPSQKKLTGYSAEETMKMSLPELVTAETAEKTSKVLVEELHQIERRKQRDISKVFEAEFNCKDGSTVWAEISVNLQFDENGEPESLFGVTRNIEDRKMAEEELWESEERFRTLVEESPLGISLIGRDGRYKYLNPRFEEIFGYTIDDVPTGKEWFRKAYPDETYRQQIVSAWVEDKNKTGIGQYRPQTFTVTCKDRSQKEIHFLPVTMENRDQFVIYEDVTERSLMEQQFQQAQKFEAIGTLAGGIAHDFNNLLMGIQGRASLMATDLEPSHPHQEHTKAIEAYIRSATDLTKQLLGLARSGKYEVKPIDANELVRSSSDMFGRTKKEIQIHKRFQDPPPVIAVDRNQIEQVLLNIYINAWQAMPDGGDLYLETQIATLDPTFCEPYQAKPGQYVKISVTDTGTGMDSVTRQRIFDPFFTTKEKGRGTGLGLASAYGIVKNHNGIILVYSEIGYGSTFNIYLPLSDKDAFREVPMGKSLIRGSETVLLVDDEEMILEVGQEMLGKLGYCVFATPSGEKAIEMVKQKGNDIDMVILDLIMPGMDGSKVFDGIREVIPQMPILLSSGYAINGQADAIMQKGCNGFIQKPFNMAGLSIKIRQILDGAKDRD